MLELVDKLVLNTNVLLERAGSSPAEATNINYINYGFTRITLFAQLC